MTNPRRPFAAAVTAATIAAIGSAGAQQPRAVAIIHAFVLDVRSGSLAPDATVVVRGRTITSVGTAAPPSDAEILDARGRVLMPGLIDAHAHFSDLRGAKLALLSGVTTARSAGVPMYADVALREMVKSGHLAGPDVLAAGVHLQPHLDDSSELSDPRLFEFITGLISPEQIRRATQVNLDHGVDVIKTSATDRAGLPDTDPRHFLFDETQLRAVVETAQRRGIPVETHAHGDEGAANAMHVPAFAA